MFGIDDAISAVSNLADTVINRIWPDATETEKAKIQQVTAEMQAEYTLLLGQLKINALEATNQRVFISGWRPFIGWICGVSLMYAGLIEPIARFIAMVIYHYIGPFPVIDTNLTLQILLGLLGLAGMRTFEKNKGVNSK